MALFKKKSQYVSFSKLHIIEHIIDGKGDILEPKLYQADLDAVVDLCGNVFEGYRLTVAKFDTTGGGIGGTNKETCTFAFLPYKANENSSVADIISNGSCEYAIMGCPRGVIDRGGSSSIILEDDAALKGYIERGFKLKETTNSELPSGN